MAEGQNKTICGGLDKWEMETPEKDKATYWKEQAKQAEQVSQAWQRRTQGLLEVYLCEYCEDDMNLEIDEQGLSWLPDHNCNIANLYGLTCRRAKYIMEDADAEGEMVEQSRLKEDNTLKKVKTFVETKLKGLKWSLEQMNQGRVGKAYSDSYPLFLLEDLLYLIENNHLVKWTFFNL